MIKGNNSKDCDVMMKTIMLSMVFIFIIMVFVAFLLNLNNDYIKKQNYINMNSVNCNDNDNYETRLKSSKHWIDFDK